VQAAVEILGPSALVRALRDLTLVSAGGPKWCAGFDYDRYWAISLARAVAAEVLVRSTERQKPEAAYTLGLLADIGRASCTGAQDLRERSSFAARTRAHFSARVVLKTRYSAQVPAVVFDRVQAQTDPKE
jgi:hypothetical protein